MRNLSSYARLRDENGICTHLKWGANRYRQLLESGTALQLAVYAAVRHFTTGASKLPSAAYFSLSKGALLATDVDRFATERKLNGPDLADTWARTERTVDLVERTLAGGDIAVTGVRRSLSLLEAANVPESERGRYLELERGAACTYCKHGALCGRSWEAFQ
jgi:hypothetical protein